MPSSEITATQSKFRQSVDRKVLFPRQIQYRYKLIFATKNWEAVDVDTTANNCGWRKLKENPKANAITAIQNISYDRKGIQFHF
jgi:hypothetical protein